MTNASPRPPPVTAITYNHGALHDESGLPLLCTTLIPLLAFPSRDKSFRWCLACDERGLLREEEAMKRAVRLVAMVVATIMMRGDNNSLWKRERENTNSVNTTLLFPGKSHHRVLGG